MNTPNTSPTSGNGAHLTNRLSYGKGEQDIDLMVLLTFLWVRKWILLLTMGVGLLCGAYYALRVAEPQFLSTTRIAFEERTPQLLNLDSMLPGASTESQAINTELEVVRSIPLVTKLVLQEGLLDDPEFNPTLTKSGLSKVIGGVKGLFGMSNDEQYTDQQILNATVRQTTTKIRTSAQRDTFLFNIGVVTTSSEKSIRLANALAQIYLDNQVTVKFEATEYAVNWLSQRVAELEQELKTSEETAKKLRENSNLVSQEALDQLSIRASGLRDRVEQTTLEIERGETNLSVLQTLLDAGDFDGFAEIVESAAFNRLLQAQPRNESALRAEATTQIAQLRSSVRSAQARLLSLQPALDELQAQIDEQTAALIRLNTLLRDVEANRALYETFLTRLKEISIQLGLQRPDSRILSEATSAPMIAPRTVMVSAFGLVFGAVVGLGLLMLQFLRHSGLQSVTATERATGLAVLGQLPLVPIKRRQDLLPYLIKNPTSAMAEAVRNLRTSLLMMQPGKPPAVVLLSSTVPGESKTTTAITLAKNVSDLGRRVLLMEADNRRLTLAEYFESDASSNLLNAMRDGGALSDVVTQTEYGFDLLMGAQSSVNAADIFSSSAFSELIERAREEYDMVIIDAPPVLAVPDARIIAPLADVLLYCIAWNATPENQIQAGLREFAFTDNTAFGTVLTKVDRKAAAQYGYGGYGYGAGAYYDT
ncbi:GumC family protein [Tropicibacter naphthalenivorans]|uniref:GumC family protein n=1 Tax=Tropicibacter naphthalenivorans TaxID=441103 RepID=UPI00071CFFA3|nr:AAA family ATPase [Tropicibacter naphthalenivorans]